MFKFIMIAAFSCCDQILQRKMPAEPFSSVETREVLLMVCIDRPQNHIFPISTFLFAHFLRCEGAGEQYLHYAPIFGYSVVRQAFKPAHKVVHSLYLAINEQQAVLVFKSGKIFFFSIKDLPRKVTLK